jgi:hypothetical protein
MSKLNEIFTKIKEYDEEQKKNNIKQSSAAYSPSGRKLPTKQFRVSGTSLMKK